MPEIQKTLYDVLGVSRDAKATDIGHAASRIQATMRREDWIPDPRFEAQFKVAIETLSDPARRDAYDATLRARTASRKSRAPLAGGIAAAVVVLAAGGYWFAGRHGAAAPKPLAREEVLQAVGPYVGELKGALMSGEVRPIGEAVVVAEDQMATTCKGFMPGATLTMKVGDYSTQASLARVDETLDVCVLAVPSMGTAVKLRQGLPASREEMHAVVIDGSGKPQVRQASISGFIDDPKGTMMQVRSAVPLPNGTPVFDSQAQLAGIVTSPHAYGEGLIVALPASRILEARNAASAATTAPTGAPRPVANPAQEAGDVPQGAARSKELQKAYDVRSKTVDDADKPGAGTAPGK
ncbi:MAG TPA: hypothetical protein VLT89_02360 [Usitatibacter sp.]|nr:hypothetical protein [Usitatibacter sp.]